MKTKSFQTTIGAALVHVPPRWVAIAGGMALALLASGCGTIDAANTDVRPWGNASQHPRPDLLLGTFPLGSWGVVDQDQEYWLLTRNRGRH